MNKEFKGLFAANSLVAKHKTRNPTELASILGIRVKEEYNLGNVQGFFTIVLGQSYIILNKSIDPQLKAFVTAHEVGHYIFDDNLSLFPSLSDSEKPNLQNIYFHRAEIPANSFAAHLLIDTDNVLQQLTAEHIDLVNMAAEYGVPQFVLQFKLKDLQDYYKTTEFVLPDKCKLLDLNLEN